MTLEISVQLTKVVASELAFARHVPNRHRYGMSLHVILDNIGGIPRSRGCLH